jgi:hypothetical protein
MNQHRNRANRRRNRVAPAIAGAIIGAASATTADASIIVSSLSSGPGYEGQTVGLGVSFAQAFLTGPQSVVAETITLKLEATKSGPSTVFASLYSDAAGSLGTSLSDSTPLGITGNVVFTLNSPVALAASTQYWVAVSGGDANGGIAFTRTSSVVQNSDVGAVFQGSSGQTGLLQVDGSVSAVPEPGGFSFSLVGAFAAWMVRRFRLAANAKS